MTWLVLRRQRAAVLLGLGLVAVTVVVLVVGRLVLEARTASLGLGACLDPNGSCVDGPPGVGLRREFTTFYRWTRIGMWLLAPVLGLVMAAALFAREVEERTVVFVLTQATSRARWWATTVLTALAVAVAGLVVAGLAARWAFAPFEVLFRQHRIEPLDFDVQGIWPLFSLLLAFALAVLAGTLLRGTLAVTVVTVLGWTVLAAALVTTRYDTLPPAVQSIPMSTYDGTIEVDGMPGDIVYRDQTGAAVSLRDFTFSCGEREGYDDCLRRGGIVAVEVEYTPDDRFWPLQLIQSGIALVVGGACLAGSYARARRLG